MLWDKENAALRAEELASDLLTLKIETVVSQRITGTAMPDPRLALCQVAERYARELDKAPLERLFECVEESLAAARNAVGLRPSPERAVSGGRPVFYFLARHAELELKKLRALPALELESHRRRLYTFERIHTNSRDIYATLCTCDDDLKRDKPETWRPPLKPGALEDEPELQLKPIECNDGMTAETVEFAYTMKELPPLELTRRQVTRLKKIWELGLEQVAMQTVIQLDGDVVTRVDPDYAGPDLKELYQIHQQSIGVSVQFWKELVSLAAALVKGLWQQIFPEAGVTKPRSPSS